MTKQDVRDTKLWRMCWDYLGGVYGTPNDFRYELLALIVASKDKDLKKFAEIVYLMGKEEKDG